MHQFKAGDYVTLSEKGRRLFTDRHTTYAGRFDGVLQVSLASWGSLIVKAKNNDGGFISDLSNIQPACIFEEVYV